ncbi:MAG TPA: hypothetical protein VGD45_08465 [Steroidobacter sp.]|uniref:hypothetical protein n=1 Tax=Steroidobacter sp. TaxID=1978227 RepID=UPI002ED778CB
MNIHTRLVGAFGAIFMSLTAAMLVAALFDVSFNTSETVDGRRGTVTIQQIAVSDTDPVRHM